MQKVLYTLIATFIISGLIIIISPPVSEFKQVTNTQKITLTKSIQKDGRALLIRDYVIRGHSYIKILREGIVHDPDCPCYSKQTIEY